MPGKRITDHQVNKYKEIESELLPLLRSAPGLTAMTLLEEMQRRHPGRFGNRLLGTLQRRVQRWRALEGEEREVFFA